LGSKEKCTMCDEKVQQRYMPMQEWGIKGPLCGKCYSKLVHEHYPGDHIRVNKDLD
tara:strand:- start:147 stop:314 length:168 start_codon:yes stop_codon:yes gene_type:complete